MDEKKQNEVLEIFKNYDKKNVLGLDIELIHNNPTFMVPITNTKLNLIIFCSVDDDCVTFEYVLGEFKESYELLKSINNFNKISNSDIKMILKNCDEYDMVYVQYDNKYESIDEINDKITNGFLVYLKLAESERYNAAFEEVMKYQIDCKY